MKNLFLRCLLAAGFAAVCASLQAQPAAHYPPGVEGIKGASLPPPGLYVRDYNYFYASHRLNDSNGKSTAPGDFDAFTYGNIPRVLWITDLKLLEGSVGLDALYPLLYQNVTAGGADDDHFGAGDLFAEATISWHPGQWDLAVGTGLWMPTGNSGRPMGTDAGLGYWTWMLTAGATWYVDEQKTWAVSMLNRYEFNTEQRDTDNRAGQVYTMEWGVSKTFEKVYDVGVVGYYQQQVTSTIIEGVGPIHRSQVAAVGPEVSVAFPKPMVLLSFRYLFEFTSESRAQGRTACLTLTKRF
jgi:hypothetical protein